MRLQHRLPMPAIVLAMALVLALPSAVGARPEGNGKQGRGSSSESRRGDSGRQGYSRGGAVRSSGERGQIQRTERPGGRGADWRGSSAPRAGARVERSERGPRTEYRSERADRGPRTDYRSERADRGLRTDYRSERADRGPRTDYRSERRDRGPRADYRSDARWRDSGRRVQAPSYRASTRYRYDGPSYRQRSYYTGSFHRPRFHYHRGFSLGVFISVVPSYGYRYYDPYCDMTLGDLDYYEDHCDEYGHPDAIQVLEFRTGYPIATCAYRGGYWVVDDCY